jgi:hypothetical protein
MEPNKLIKRRSPMKVGTLVFLACQTMIVICRICPCFCTTLSDANEQNDSDAIGSNLVTNAVCHDDASKIRQISSAWNAIWDEAQLGQIVSQKMEERPSAAASASAAMAAKLSSIQL